MSISHKDWGDGTSNGPMSVRTAREVYKSLKTPEAVTIYCSMPISTPVSLPAMPAIGADVRETDDTFFKVFDFRFVNGKPYDEATFNAGTPVAVITESISRALFGSTESAGKEFLLNHAPYRVVGVVKMYLLLPMLLMAKYGFPLLRRICLMIRGVTSTWG